MFSGLHIHNWRQFRRVELHFHPRLTILTGANGAAKTTLLHLLNRHWGWNLNYVSSPRFTKKGLGKYWAGFWGDLEEDLTGSLVDGISIGTIRYKNGGIADLFVPREVTEVFSVDIRGMQNIPGVYVPSHRPAYVHQKVQNIPTQVNARKQF